MYSSKKKLEVNKVLCRLTLLQMRGVKKRAAAKKKRNMKLKKKHLFVCLHIIDYMAKTIQTAQ